MNKQLKCYINARFLTQSVTGVQRVGVEVVKALNGLISQNPDILNHLEFEMLAPKNILRELKLQHIPLRCVGRLKGHLWEQIELPWFARKAFLIGLCNVAPLLKRNQMVTIHDASVFPAGDTYSFAFRTWYRILYPGLGKISRRIITVSEFSKHELMQFAGISPKKIVVITNGKEHIRDIKADMSIYEQIPENGKPFILAVSSMSQNKNFKTFMTAIELLDNRDFNIVIAGGTNPKVFSRQNIELPQSIHYLGYVSDEALKALYEKATAFIYPSTYEGFGLPPVEAMACGCPVIVSSIAPLREVCGDSVLYCNPYDPQDIANKMCKIIRDEKLRQNLIEKGHKKVKQYCWSKTAYRYLEIIAGLHGIKVSIPFAETEKYPHEKSINFADTFKE